MGSVNLNNGRIIGDYKEPYIIAELNSSHDGNIDTAKKMIAVAKECGCDCVKLQSFSTESLFAEEYYESNRILKRFVEKFSLDESELSELNDYCAEIGIDFSSTPYSEQEAYFLSKTNAPFIKISSMDVNNIPFLKYIAGLGKALILSTGMATMDEIEEAVNAIEETGNRNLCLLHCVSVYPADPSIINLNNILELRDRFPDYPIGYSDHTLGVPIPCAAIALGAAVIEKHFTLDSSKKGMDNDMAAEPEMMKEIVRGCKTIFQGMGIRERILSDQEKEYRCKIRRSLVAKRTLQAGETIKAEDITAKRPGTGLEPKCLMDILGMKVKNSISEDHLIRMEDLC